MRQSTTFALSVERGNQLRQLALEKRISVAELVTRWIDREFIETNLPTSHPVIVVSIAEDHGKVDLTAELFGAHTLHLDVPQAASLAASMASVIEGRFASMLNVDAGCVAIHKRGTGIVIEHGAFKRSMPVYEAREIAAELAEAAEQYAKAA